MPFGVVSGVGRGMSVLAGGGDRRMERGSFGSKHKTFRCKQWDFLREGRRRGSSQITFGFFVSFNRSRVSCIVAEGKVQ